jgi:hypothetical protein
LPKFLIGFGNIRRAMAAALVPDPVEVLGDDPELDCLKVLGPALAPLLLPQPDQGLLVLPHDDPGIRAADEVPAIDFNFSTCLSLLHARVPFLD